MGTNIEILVHFSPNEIDISMKRILMLFVIILSQIPASHKKSWRTHRK